MRLKDIHNCISISLILLIFIVICVYSSDIEYFENSGSILETRVNNIESKYKSLMSDIDAINTRTSKYDKMYGWYETKLATDQAAADKASKEAQGIFKEAASNPKTAGESTITSITDNMVKGAASTGNEDNQRSLESSLKEFGPP